ncbi:hypothetical protein Sjap_017263 [Stephania japonica]|uniref:Red chlorophyll catabolite reductase n=1 Tax=Stephania japonica TaxID=461633 RepID=A0AAP0I5X9_9MAGN
MVVLLLSTPFVLPPLSFSFRSTTPPKLSLSLSASSSSTSSFSSMDPQIGRPRFTDFPHLSAPHRDLMVQLVSTVETRLSSHLLPSSLPPDVEYYQNETASSQGTLHIRSAHPDSPVDFILGSWLYCTTPTGSLNVTTLTAYLNSKTDAPRLLMEFLQTGPTSMILILDLPPRRDMVLHKDYLQHYYVDPNLDHLRQRLQILPEVQPYFASSLYIRCALSPAAVSVVISCRAPDRMEEIMRDQVSSVAKEMLEIWLERCARGGVEFGEGEREVLEKRDRLIKESTVEIDLRSSLPRLFGEEVGSRVIGAIKEAFKL